MCYREESEAGSDADVEYVEEEAASPQVCLSFLWTFYYFNMEICNTNILSVQFRPQMFNLYHKSEIPIQ